MRAACRFLLVTTLIGSSLIPAALAADPQPYKVTLAKTGDGALDTALTQSSSLISLNTKAPVGPFALVARAQDDVGRFTTALRSAGYYASTVKVTIAGRPLDDPGLPTALDATPAATTVPVDVAFDRGPLFHLRRVSLTGDAIPPDVRAKFGLESGQPAIASAVLAGHDRVLTALQDDGYALAKVDPLVVTLIADAQSLDVSEHVTTGPRLDIGAITFTGLDEVNDSYVRRRLLLKPGEQYSPASIEKARQDLASLAVFSSVRVTAADHVDASGRLPVTIAFTERPRHIVSLGAAYSTDLGGSVTASWEHRNLFGNGETLTLSAAATELGGSDAKQPGYNVGAIFTKPDWLVRDQTLTFNATALKEYLDSYNRTAFILGGSVERKLTPNITVSAGLVATQEKVTQEGTTRNYELLGVPIGVKFDNTDSLFEPTRGFRASASVTPTESFGGTAGSTTFVITRLSGSTYVNFFSGKTILALRALLGSVTGASRFELPPDQRFYGGGSDSIRGYKYQYVSPHFADNKPQGGTSIDAATIELRQRVWGSIGAVAFVDAGQVGTGGSPGDGKLRVGAGIGARYYTAIGPIRADFAVPLVKEPGSDAFEIYIGIGEAF